MQRNTKPNPVPRLLHEEEVEAVGGGVIGVAIPVPLRPPASVPHEYLGGLPYFGPPAPEL